jgi:hypothetical protein
MKKIISLILVLVMVLTLTGCKSAEVKDLEAQIAELAGLSMETLNDVDAARERIVAVRNAYNALSAKDQGKVENLADLEAAEKKVFEAEYDLLVSLMSFLNVNTDYVASGVITVWDNVGASKFWTYYNVIFFFDDENKTLDEYSAEYGQSLFASLWCAGSGLCPSKISGSKIKDEAGVIKVCATYNLAYDNVEQAVELIQERVARLNSEHADDYPTKMAALYDWWMESYLYAQLAMNPEGSLASYTSSVKTYQNNIDRLSMNAEMQ